MERATLVDGVPLRVHEMTGEPGGRAERPGYAARDARKMLLRHGFDFFAT